MTKTAGTKGYVDTASKVVGINTWTIDYTIDELETTDFNDAGVATYLTGISRWGGTFSGYKDGVFQTIGTTSITIVLAANASASSGFTGVANITGVHSTTPVDGIATAEYDFRGTGILTVPLE